MQFLINACGKLKHIFICRIEEETLIENVKQNTLKPWNCYWKKRQHMVLLNLKLKGDWNWQD